MPSILEIEGAIINELMQGLSTKDREFVAEMAANVATSVIAAVGKAYGSDKNITVHALSLCSTIARVASHGLNATYKANKKPPEENQNA